MRKFYGVGEDVPFQVYITPLDNEKTTGEWVPFPTTPEAMKELFLRLDIGPSDWNIVNVECNVYGIRDVVWQCESLDELNYLAAKLEGLSDGELAEYQLLLRSKNITIVFRNLSIWRITWIVTALRLKSLTMTIWPVMFCMTVTAIPITATPWMPWRTILTLKPLAGLLPKAKEAFLRMPVMSVPPAVPSWRTMTAILPRSRRNTG